MANIKLEWTVSYRRSSCLTAFPFLAVYFLSICVAGGALYAFQFVLAQLQGRKGRVGTADWNVLSTGIYVQIKTILEILADRRIISFELFEKPLRGTDSTGKKGFSIKMNWILRWWFLKRKHTVLKMFSLSILVINTHERLFYYIIPINTVSSKLL